MMQYMVQLSHHHPALSPCRTRFPIILYYVTLQQRRIMSIIRRRGNQRRGVKMELLRADPARPGVVGFYELLHGPRTLEIPLIYPTKSIPFPQLPTPAGHIVIRIHFHPIYTFYSIPECKHVMVYSYLYSYTIMRAVYTYLLHPKNRILIKFF